MYEWVQDYVRHMVPSLRCGSGMHMCIELNTQGHASTSTRNKSKQAIVQPLYLVCNEEQ